MRSSDVVWSADGLSGSSWLGKTLVHNKVQVVSKGNGDSPDFVAEFAIRNSIPECISFVWRAKPEGRGLRTSDLHGIQLDGLTAKAFLVHASRESKSAEDERTRWAMIHDVDSARARRPKGPTDDELKQVAATYRQNVDGRPTEAVSLHFGLAYRTAARRIEQARQAGYLARTTRGKKGG